MPQRDAAGLAAFVDLWPGIVSGMYPLPLLEAMIARLEVAR